MRFEHIDVGIDIGMRRLAIGWPHFKVARSTDLGKTMLISRDHELRVMQDWLRRNVPNGVQLWIDQAFAGARDVSMAQKLTETISAVYTAQVWQLPPILVHQSTWKSQVIGNNNASKVEIREWLEANHPDLAAKCLTEDETDAMVIGLYGKGRSAGLIAPPDIKRPKRRSKKT